MLTLMHLTSSTFFGGPERQMLGLAHVLRGGDTQTVFASFPEGGNSRAFLKVVADQGFDFIAIENDWPHWTRCVGELSIALDRVKADILFCHGYKANILGRLAARARMIPVVGVSRGWTGENFRVSCYEWVDRFHLRLMDAIVAVSNAQADRILRYGVKPDRVHVIHNAVDPDRFVDLDPRYRRELYHYFGRPRPNHIIMAAGRLSPEKGFDVLISAASRVIDVNQDVGFIIFGDGLLKNSLRQQIVYLGLTGRVVLGGFRSDLDRFYSHLDLFVLPSYTEGLPNVVLEACAAGVPVVATSVGGTPEIIDSGINGFLVPPGDPIKLADCILNALECKDRLTDMGFMARQRVLEHFSFSAQAQSYRDLIAKLCPENHLSSYRESQCIQ